MTDRLPPDAFAHTLAFLEHGSVAALTLTGRAFGARDAFCRRIFLRRSALRVPASVLEAAAGDESTSRVALELLRSSDVTKLSLKLDEEHAVAPKDTADDTADDGHGAWSDALVQLLVSGSETDAGRKIAMARISGRSPALIASLRCWQQLPAHLPNLVELDLADVVVPTIAWLPALAKLQRLSLNATQLQDADALAPLSEMTNLTTLAVVYLFASDASVLSTLTRLRSLSLKGCPAFADLSAVGRLQQLETLKLWHVAPVRDFTFVQELPALQVLDMLNAGSFEGILLPEPAQRAESGGGDDDPPLRRLQLKKLSIQYAPLQNVHMLALCPQLEVLTLKRVDPPSFETLASVRELRSLTLSIERVRGVRPDLAPLVSLSKLTHLELCSYSEVAQSNQIPALPSLETLVLPGVDDLGVICERQKSLVTLLVRLCSQRTIDQAAQLVTLPRLRKLTLEFTVPDYRRRMPLDLTPLESLVQLRELQLPNASIEDLTPLKALTNLEALDLSVGDTRIGFTAPIHSIRDLTPLASLAKLTKLSLIRRSEVRESDVELLHTNRESGHSPLQILE